MQIFTKHPATVNETYRQHMGRAFSFSVEMIVGGLACMVHGVVPACFEKTGGNAVRRLHATMVVNRNRSQIQCNDGVE
ncbi:MAG: hypothetical protein JKY63_03475 [Rhodobiaceae bacterium]|nr:hypothetical protein [Rhodobiaceae bacterium]